MHKLNVKFIGDQFAVEGSTKTAWIDGRRTEFGCDKLSAQFAEVILNSTGVVTVTLAQFTSLKKMAFKIA
ncbi:unnamed protein product [marine sediment metagenome]|uniref:Uncharacterized protein n=1 Tax=marine sediment metagenome TaxID=412755 RepID=X0T960_9ZZZZ